MTNSNLDKKLEEAKFALDAKFKKLQEDENNRKNAELEVKNKLKPEVYKYEKGDWKYLLIGASIEVLTGAAILGLVYLGIAIAGIFIKNPNQEGTKFQTEQIDTTSSKKPVDITSKLYDTASLFQNTKTLFVGIVQDYEDSINSKKAYISPKQESTANDLVSTKDNQYTCPPQVDPVTGKFPDVKKIIKDESTSNRDYLNTSNNNKLEFQFNGRSYSIDDISQLNKTQGNKYVPMFGHSYIINDTLFNYTTKVSIRADPEYIFLIDNCMCYRYITTTRFNNLYQNGNIIDVTQSDIREREQEELWGKNSTQKERKN